MCVYIQAIINATFPWEIFRMLQCFDLIFFIAISFISSVDWVFPFWVFALMKIMFIDYEWKINTKKQTP